MSAPAPSLSGGSPYDFYDRVAIVRSSDNRVIDIIMSSGSAYTDAYGIPVTTVPVNVGEACEIYWLYDQFNVGARFYSDGANYEESLTTPMTVFPGSIAVGNNPPISNRGYHIQFPDGTTQDSAVNRTRLTTFTALQEFAAGISSGQILTVDPIDGAGLIAVKALSGGNTRIGAVRLGYAPTPTYNTFLENSSGTFTIYNGFSATGSNLLNISTTKMVVNVPVDGIYFRTGITAPNIVYSINGCTGTLGITGTVNEIEVTGPCPNIVIGLPDNVTVAGILQAAGLSATTATFGNIYAPNIVTSINGRTGAITGLTASQILVGSSNVNGTRYITFVGGSGNTSIFIDDVTTPLTYNPVQGNIGAKKVVLTTTSNVLTLDSASPNIVLTDGANISTFGLDSFASNNAIPFELSASNGLTLTSYNGGIAMSGSGYYYKFPESNGSNNQVLTTNGAGTLSWSTVSGGSGSSTNGLTAMIDFSKDINQIKFTVYTTNTGVSILGEATKAQIYQLVGSTATIQKVDESLIVVGTVYDAEWYTNEFTNSTNPTGYIDIVMKPPFYNYSSPSTTYTAEEVIALGLTAFSGGITATPPPNYDALGITGSMELLHNESTYVIKTITGQSWVAADSYITCKCLGLTSTDHDPEDAILEGVRFEINNIVPSTGFDIIGHAPEGTYGKYQIKCLGQ